MGKNPVQERCAALFDALPMGIVEQEADGTIGYANPSALRILGLTEDQIRGRTSADPGWHAIREDGSEFPGKDHPSMVSLGTGVEVRGVVMGVHNPRTGTRTWIRINATPLFEDGRERPSAVFTTIEDITREREIQKELEESEERYRLLFRANVAGMALHEIICDAAGRPVNYRFLDVNPAFEHLTGLKAEAVIGRMVTEAVPGTDASLIERYGRVALTGEPDSFEYTHPGLRKSYAINAYSPKPGQFGAVFVDITERKEAEARVEALLGEKELLLREVHHRVKNNLAAIASLLSLQAASLSDGQAASALKEARSRVETMMRIYDRIYRTGDYRTISIRPYLTSLIRDVAAVYARPEIGIEERVEEIALPSGSAFPIGIIVYELVTNAYKYAFPGGRRGTIRVGLSGAPSDSLELRVGDDGVGLPPGADPDEPRGFGFTLIQLLSNQLDGRVEIRREGGTEFRIAFPAPHPAVNR